METSKSTRHPLVLWLSLVAASASACVSTDDSSKQPPKPASTMPDWSISLSKGPCEGTCPDYTLVVSGGGSLQWNGRQSVAGIGNRTASVQPAQVDVIFARLDSGRFDDWFAGRRSKNYTQKVAPDGTVHVVLEAAIDAPLTTLTVTRRGIKRALTYVTPPPAVVEVERLILDLPDVRRWAERPLRW